MLEAGSRTLRTPLAWGRICANPQCSCPIRTTEDYVHRQIIAAMSSDREEPNGKPKIAPPSLYRNLRDRNEPQRDDARSSDNQRRRRIELVIRAARERRPRTG